MHMTGKHVSRRIRPWMMREHKRRNLVRCIHAANAQLTGRITRMTVVIAPDQQDFDTWP